MSLLRNPLYLAVILGHFTIDVFGSAGPVLVTFLSVPMLLSAAQIGLAISAYQLVNAGSQPLFGWLADRFGTRWIGPLSVVWVVIFMMLALAVAQMTGSFGLFFIFFTLGALGSGAFHPQGVMQAATLAEQRAATGTAVFFLFGQIGLGSGPFLTGLILDGAGLSGIYSLALAAIPLILFIAYAFLTHTGQGQTPFNELPIPKPSTAGPGLAAVIHEPIQWWAISLLAVLIGLRSWAFLGTVAFLPKMFQEMGWSPTAYGGITAIYWLMSAVMGVFAGNWADRWGRRQVVSVTLLLGAIPLYFLPLNSGWLAFPLAILVGGLMGSPQSILVVIAQGLLPGSKSLASGVTLGYMFGIGAVATWAIGTLAEVWSLTAVVQAGAAVGVIAALLALLLPSTRAALASQSTPTTVHSSANR